MARRRAGPPGQRRFDARRERFGGLGQMPRGALRRAVRREQPARCGAADAGRLDQPQPGGQFVGVDAATRPLRAA
ncbi:MAG TPA: hypothetical protein PKZ28_10855 [Piscinibacter sp.]|nr:hypothetical protein [Piscinibacter sp.]